MGSWCVRCSIDSFVALLAPAAGLFLHAKQYRQRRHCSHPKWQLECPLPQASAAMLAGSAFSSSAVTSAAAPCLSGAQPVPMPAVSIPPPPFHALSAVLPIDVAKTRIQTAFPGSVNNVGILQNMRLMWQTGDTLVMLSNCEVVEGCSD